MERTLVLLLALAFALPATTIAAAEAVFIAGGDQSNYVDEWTATPLTYRNVDVYRRAELDST
jgi:cyanophycinase-like exopeptidase